MSIYIVGWHYRQRQGLAKFLVLTSFKPKQRLNKTANVKLTNQCQITERQAGTTARLFANEEMTSVCQNFAKPNVVCSFAF